MPGRYITVTGDGYALISRKQYGTEEHASLIESANPGTTNEPFVAGIVLDIPEIPGDPKNLFQDIPFASENEVAILVDGKRFRYWESVQITRSIDAIDTVTIGTPFSAETPEFRKTFVPFSYKPMQIMVGGKVLFSGTIIGVTPVLEADKKILAVTAYSLPGVLNDCTAPISAFPLEFNGMGLRDIATRLANPFGIGVSFTTDEGETFGSGSFLDRVAIGPTERILPYLAKLAKERELVMSNTIQGELLFLKSIETAVPVANLTQGSPPLMSVVPTFSPQEYYSSITAVPVVIIGKGGTAFTQQNKKLEGVIRPLTFEVHDTFEPDLETPVAAKMGRMFANMVSYTVTVNTWRDKNGDLWNPNTILQLHAPDAMVYNPSNLLIRTVDFIRGVDSEIAVLNLVLPGAFSGKAPEVFPWED